MDAITIHAFGAVACCDSAWDRHSIATAVRREYGLQGGKVTVHMGTAQAVAVHVDTDGEPAALRIERVRR